MIGRTVSREEAQRLHRRIELAETRELVLAWLLILALIGLVILASAGAGA